MAYTLVTWNPGDLITSVKLAQMVANDLLIFSGRTPTLLAFTSAGVVITSTSFVNVDATNMKMSITTVGTRIRGFWQFGLQTNITTTTVQVRTLLDGVTAGYGLQFTGNAGSQSGVYLPFLFSGLSVGTHSVTLQALVTSNQASVVGSFGTFPIGGQLIGETHEY